MQSSSLFNVLFVGVLFGTSMFGAGFCLGLIRVLVVAPSIGELYAVLMELPLMFLICWLLSKSYLQKLDSPNSGFIMGSVAFATLLLFEVALSLLVFDKTVDETLQDFTTIKGKIGLIGQVISSFFPVIQLWAKPKQRQE